MVTWSYPIMRIEKRKKRQVRLFPVLSYWLTFQCAHVPELVSFSDSLFLCLDKIIKTDFFSHNKAQCGKEHAEHHCGTMPKSPGSWFKCRIQRSLRQAPIVARQTSQGQDSRPSSYTQSCLRRRFYLLRHRRKPTPGRPIYLATMPRWDGQPAGSGLVIRRFTNLITSSPLFFSIFRVWRSISSSWASIDTLGMTSLVKCCCLLTKL
jgi:hypothetical protein